MKFINLDLSIEPGPGGGYRILADSDRFGQARAACQLDVAGSAIPAQLAAMAEDQLDREALVAFGRMLGASLLAGPVGDLFGRMAGAVQSQPKQGVRIRLRVNVPELNVLPWELLQAERSDYPIGISRQSVLTRYIEMNEPVREVEAPKPLRMLGIIPQGSGLQTDKEKAALEKAVAGLGSALQLKWLEGIVTRDHIRDALGEAEYHLVHFIGHGTMEDDRAALRINDDYGDEYSVSAEAFAGFFRDSGVRLVVLNACRGAARTAANAMKGVAPQVVRLGVPAVVAMQWDINDRVAQQFAKSFYRSLCIGPEAGQVDTAVTRGRGVLYDDWPGSKAFATPVLFLRAQDGRLWRADEEEDDEDERGPAKTSAVPQTVTNIGTQINAGNIEGDYVGRDKKTVTHGHYASAAEGANVTIGQPAGASRDVTSGSAYAALVAQASLWQTTIKTRIEGLSGLSADEKKDLADQVGKIKLEAIKKEMDTARLAKLINVLGVMGGNELIEFTVKRLSEPLNGVGVLLKMNTDFKVSADREG